MNSPHMLVIEKDQVVTHINDDGAVNAFRHGYGRPTAVAVVVDEAHRFGIEAYVVMVGSEVREVTFSKAHAKGYAKGWNRLRSRFEGRATILKKMVFVAAESVDPKTLPRPLRIHRKTS